MRIWAAFAAVAGDLRDELRAVLVVDRGSPYQGRMTNAAIAAAEAGLAAREGRWDEVHTGYRSALDAIHESGYFIYEAMIGLEWGMLAGSRDPEALAAGEAGAAFFADRGAERRGRALPGGLRPGRRRGARAQDYRPARSGVPSA